MRVFLCLFNILLSGSLMAQLNADKWQEIKELDRLISWSDSMDIVHEIRKGEIELHLAHLPAGQSDLRQQSQKKYIQLVESDSLRKAELQQKVNDARKFYSGHRVVVFNDSLFAVYSGSGPISAEDRALYIGEQIMGLLDNDDSEVEKLSLKESGKFFEIMSGKTRIMIVSKADALWNNKSQMLLASEYLSTIQDKVNSELERKSSYSLVRRIIEFVGLVVFLYFFVTLINKGVKKVNIKIKAREFGKEDKIGFFRFIKDERGINFLIKIINGAKVLFIALVFYLLSPILFGLLPWTKNWSERLVHWTLEPFKNIILAAVNYLPNLLTIIVIMTVVHYFSRLMKFIAVEIEKGAIVIPGFYADWAQTTYNIARFLLYAFMFVIIFPYLPGSDSPIFKGVSVFLGVLLSIGSSSAISNMVSGLVITYMRPFKVGDFVKIGDVVGLVLEKNLLVTRVKTIKNEQITVPNSSILSGHTINYSAANISSTELILNTSVTMGYDIPWRQVHELLINAALATNGIVKDPKPYVLQTSLDDFYVSYEINAYTNMPLTMYLVYSELHQNIQDTFFEAGVEIMSPHYTTLRDGNAAAVPANYLPKDYKVPAFRVEKTD